MIFLNPSLDQNQITLLIAKENYRIPMGNYKNRYIIAEWY